jgi:hypothetical protein
MTATRRGRTAIGVVSILAVIAGLVFAVVFLGGRSRGPLAAGNPPGGTGSSPGAPPPICPLSGLAPRSGKVPVRPALAVKVENLPAARPQTGLSWADIVYEEPVEANITRFIVVYQCQDASRIEPVRSARLTDPDIVDQFGRPLFAYAGGVPEVVRKVRAAGLIDLGYTTRAASSAYHRDSSRSAPHNLYTSTKELYASVRSLAGPPQPVFTYALRPPAGSVRGISVHLPFSMYSDVHWRYSRAKRVYYRWHGTVPHTLSDGSQVSAKNVVVQLVQIRMTDIIDPNGVRSPEVVATGSGTAYVFRNGRMIRGTWSRPSLSGVTKFLDVRGNEIPLAPGNTWVELLPNTIPVTFN